MSYEKQRTELIGICKDLLEQGKVNVILGFEEGQTPGTSSPFFIRTAEEVERLKWDDTCTTMLAKYLLEKKQGAAVIAKPCDSRAIAMYMAENQLDRKNIYIIGVECAGMKHRDRMEASWCRECNVRIPTIYDVLVKYDTEAAADKNESEAEGDKFAVKSVNEKMERFMAELNKCNLCYTCRQACYGCYCESCFMDRNLPNWLPGELDFGAKMAFHLGRAIHLAGRCVGCGACESACPSNVNIRYLVKDLADFCDELYGYRPGLDPVETPAMSTFDPNDKEIGFMGGEQHDSCCDSKE